MIVEVKVPSVGESVNEGLLSQWFVQDGEQVEPDQELFELETDKASMSVQAEAGGRIEIVVAGGEEVEAGQLVGKIDTDASGEQTAQTPAEQSADAPAQEKAASASKAPKREDEDSDREGDSVPLSPAVRRLVAENDLDPADIEGSGRGGRITREDVVAYIEQRKKAATAEKAPAPPPQPAAPGPRPVEMPGPEPRREAEPRERQTRRSMSPLRKRIAQRLVEAQQSAAILTTFNEADMSNVIAWRNKHKERFQEQYGVKLGFMSFFIKASIHALQAVPQVNAQIDGDEIVENHFYDIGVAVGTDRGLVVPVIRDADQLSFAQLEAAVADLAHRAQEKKLSLDELSGGCFTVSNGGVYGSLLSTPILNPPQSGILGMHAIKKRPVAVGDSIELRPMMYLALSYDHRLVDGRESVTFLRRIVECIEDPERMMLEV